MNDARVYINGEKGSILCFYEKSCPDVCSITQKRRKLMKTVRVLCLYLGNHGFFALYKTLVPTYLELQPVAAHLLVVRVYGVKPDDVGVVGAPLPAAAGGGAGDARKSKKNNNFVFWKRG